MGSSCDLWQHFLEGISTPGNPFYHVGVTSLGVMLVAWVASVLTQNYSQVDKLWSIVPFLYAWMTVADTRTLLMAVLATVWGVRLTFNFSRRGGYKWPPWDGVEDYRWETLRQGELLTFLTNRIAWEIFNLLFISVYQNLLLVGMIFPSFVAQSLATSCNSPSPLNILDAVATCLLLTFVFIETMADNQQLAFQREKYRRISAEEPLNGDYADGFNQSGLFAVVRKPNYAAEQAIWISYYLFSVAAGASWLNWSALGWIFLCMLFQGSGYYTESLTRKKYPKYENEYMKRVPLYIPSPWMLLGGFKKAKVS